MSTNMTSTPQAAVTLFSTRLGWMALASQNDCITDVWFGYQDNRELQEQIERRSPGIQEDDDPTETVKQARELLIAYAEGQNVDFSQLKLDLGKKTPFQKKIIETTRRIPAGTTLSYGELAERAGFPKAARAVGTVMSSNRIPLIIPCHRVVGHGGKPGGYSAPGALTMKKTLLDLETSSCGQRQGKRK